MLSTFATRPVKCSYLAEFVQSSVVLTTVVLLIGTLGASPARAQGHDRLTNGVLIGAAVGAGAGVAFTHAVRDSDLDFGQYARGALIFGAIGAGAGLGVDALLARSSRPVLLPRRLLVAPSVWRDVAGVVVKWRW